MVTQRFLPHPVCQHQLCMQIDWLSGEPWPCHTVPPQDSGSHFNQASREEKKIQILFQKPQTSKCYLCSRLSPGKQSVCGPGIPPEAIILHAKRCSCAPKIQAVQRKRWRGPRDRTKKRDKDVRLIKSQDPEAKRTGNSCFGFQRYLELSSEPLAESTAEEPLP